MDSSAIATQPYVAHNLERFMDKISSVVQASRGGEYSQVSRETMGFNLLLQQSTLDQTFLERAQKQAEINKATGNPATDRNPCLLPSGEPLTVAKSIEILLGSSYSGDQHKELRSVIYTTFADQFRKQISLDIQKHQQPDDSFQDALKRVNGALYNTETSMHKMLGLAKTYSNAVTESAFDRTIEGSNKQTQEAAMPLVRAATLYAQAQEHTLGSNEVLQNISKNISTINQARQRMDPHGEEIKKTVDIQKESLAATAELSGVSTRHRI